MKIIIEKLGLESFQKLNEYVVDDFNFTTGNTPRQMKVYIEKIGEVTRVGIPGTEGKELLVYSGIILQVNSDVSEGNLQRLMDIVYHKK